MKSLLPIVGLTVLLAACQQPQAPVSVASVGVTGNSTLIVGQSTSLTPTLKDASGNALTGRTVTWTSSAPELISVDSTGKITARHFSLDASKKTVTITATSEGKTGSINVMPYGFDISCGTFKVSTDTNTLVAFYTRFRMPDGTAIAADTEYSVAGPAFAADKPLVGKVFKATSSGGVYGGTVAVDGTYNASIQVNGVTYTDSCVTDTKAVLGMVASPSVSVVGSQVKFAGTAPAGATHVYAGVLNTSIGYLTGAQPIATPAFDLTAPITATPPAGTYDTFIYARNYSNSSPMPDTVLWSAVKVGTVTLP